MPLVDDTRSSLAALASIPGVSIALVMDGNGFVIEWAGEVGADTEDVAAAASSLLEASGRIERDLGQGLVRSVICEFEGTVVLVVARHAGARLAVVLEDGSALPAVQERARQVMPALERV
jgi:predicted regulator of Ras-like GTPase activity (Roadblock/LC7/MglB family)